VAKDSLARGARSAQFFTGPGTAKGKTELKNLSSDGRDTSLDKVVISPVAYKERKVRPINKQLLVKRIAIEESTESGILIEVQATKDRPAEGSVLAVSDLVSQVMVGDHILFGKYAGTEVKVGGTADDLPILMDEEEVLGIVED
jgi:chaperonin GroES